MLKHFGIANIKKINYVIRNEIHIAVPTVPEFSTYETDTVFFFVALRAMASSFLILEVSRSHAATHRSRSDSGRVISSSQRPLSDKIKHNRQTSMTPVGFEPTVSAGKRP